jgi:hypothetical protein
MVKQQDLDGKEAKLDVTAEERMTVSEVFWHGHFFLRVGAKTLNDIQELDDPAKRREKLYKKVKARPDAEDIPKGAKKEESDVLIAAALATNVRGKY